MKKRGLQTEFITAIAAAFLVLAFVQHQMSVPRGLSGIEVSEDLVIQAGSRLPAASLLPGDQIVSVENKPVVDLSDLSIRLWDATESQVDVRIEQRNRSAVVLASSRRLEDDLADKLAQSPRILRIGDRRVDEAMTADELKQVLSSLGAGGATEIEYVLPPARVSGPISISRGESSAVAIGWIGLGGLSILGMLIAGANALTKKRRYDPAATVALGLGSLSLAGMTAIVLTPGVEPGLPLWVAAIAVLWRGVSFGRRLNDESRRPRASTYLSVLAPALLIVVGAFVVATGRVGLESDRQWFEQVTQFSWVAAAAFAAVHLADLAYFGKREHTPRIVAQALKWGGIGGVLVGAALLLVGKIPAGQMPFWTLLLPTAALWIGDLTIFQPSVGLGRVLGRDGADDTTSRVLRLLAHAESQVPAGKSVGLYVGFDDEFVRVCRVDPTGSGEFSVRTEVAGAPLSPALAMLALEGGMFPRPRNEDGSEDPFADISARLSIDAAVPLQMSNNEESLSVFLVVSEASDSSDRHGVDIDRIVSILDEIDATHLYDELSALAATALIRAAKRASARNESGSGVAARIATTGTLRPIAVPFLSQSSSPTAPLAPIAPSSASGPAPIVAPPAVSILHVPDPVAGAWAERLDAIVAREYPTDDPEAFDSHERLALKFLSDTEGPALLVGEAGVGKEFIARAIHAESDRSGHRFAVLDCATTPSFILEVELFGEDGEAGLVEIVGSGTLLLKSFGSIAPELIDELLPRLLGARCRVVFAERYRGPEAGIPSVVPAAIRHCVDDRHLHLKPLRERPEDVRRYAEYFLHRYAMRYGAGAVELSADAADLLGSLDLPANFHDLKTRIRAAVLSCTGRTLRATHLRAVDRSESVGFRDGNPLERVNERASAPVRDVAIMPPSPQVPAAELKPNDASFRASSESRALAFGRSGADSSDYSSVDSDGDGADDGRPGEADPDAPTIRRALEAAGGNRTRAAEMLGISRGKLLRKLKRMGDE